MSNFSDDQDARLVRLVRPYLQNKQSIQWDTVTKRMGAKGKSKNALRERLKTLKKTHGKNLNRFPSTFFRTRSRPQPTQFYIAPNTRQHSVQSKAKQLATAHQISDVIFRGITQQDVRQLSGKTHLNAGEITPTGVSTLVKELNVTMSDTFGDIGCGIGNVLVQVAVESNVQACIGVEVRPELVATAHSALFQHSAQYPELLTVSIFHDDICSISHESHSALALCSVILANNLVFEEAANCALDQFLCVASVATRVVVGRSMCPRHRDSCQRIFCLLWRFK